MSSALITISSWRTWGVLCFSLSPLRFIHYRRNHTLCLLTLIAPLNSFWPQVILVVPMYLFFWIYQHCWSVAFLSPHLFWFHFPPYLATLLHVNILYFLPCLAETKLDHCFLSSYIHWLKDLQVKNKTNIFRRKQRCISIWHWEGLLTTQKAQTMKEDEWQYRVWETYVANTEKDH